jgi:hypothetical protein
MLIEAPPSAVETTVTEWFAGFSVAFAGSVSTSQTIPDFIPADQAYFWSVPWQESERRALADIAAGRSQTFADPGDAVRYLLGGEPQ